MSPRASLLRHYGPAVVLTLATLAVVTTHEGGRGLAAVLVLAALEVTFSVDNAVMNSQTLAKMSRFWRAMFLTVGIAVAVFGVRLLLPVAMVAMLSHLSLARVAHLALHDPRRYAEHLESAYPTTAAFGGVFLLMIGLRFFAKRRDVHWLGAAEARLSAVDRPWRVPLGGAAVSLALIAWVLAPHDARVLLAGVAGVVAFVLLRLLTEWLAKPRREDERPSDAHPVSGAVRFLYLELLDASFSLDGVVAAFAVTREVLLIAAGLGIGALYVRAITTHLLEREALREYRYLVHGAHYAITVLALTMLVDIRWDPPPLLAGLTGLGLVGASWWSSHRENRAVPAEQPAPQGPPVA